MKWLTPLFLLVFAPACSTSSTSSPGPSSGSNPPVTFPDGGAVPTLSCGDENTTSVAGTWDIIGTSASSEQSTAALTITENEFAFAAGGKSLTFTANGGAMTLVWQDETKTTPVTTTHDAPASPFSVGLFPLPAPGTWTFTSTTGNDSCTASVGAAGFNASCNGARTQTFGDLKGTVVGQRLETRSSLFGELGGVWRLASDGAAIDVTISGNTFTAVTSGEARSSWVEVKVCNAKGSGVTSDGFEFSATRQ